jgi:putative ABC transport system permease protein
MKASDLILRLRALLLRSRGERELHEELETHLELQSRKYISQGLTPEEGRRRARAEFGGVEQVREECRDVRGVRWIENFGRDLRYGVRTLRRTPGFTATTVLALAIGIGASVALLHCFLSALRPALPFRDPQRLVDLWRKSKKDPNYNEMLASAGELSDWHSQSRSFSAFAATSWTENRNFGGTGLPERVRSFRVTPSLFEVLGIQPQYGRAFLESERSGDRVAILGNAFCAAHFSSPEAALGSGMRLDGETYRIVGVLPPYFAIGFLARPDILIPVSLNAVESDRSDHSFLGLARLRDGISIDAAREEMAAVAESVAREHLEDAGWAANLNLLAEEGTQDARQKLPFFAALAAVVLLLACANSAALSLARYLTRLPEMTMRSALGAGRARLAQQILCESLLVSILAGGAGFAIALGGISLVRRYEPFYSNFPIPAIPDARIFGLFLLLIGGVALLFGAAPALQISRSAAAPQFGLVSSRIAPGRGRLQAFSMIFQVGAAVAVLCITGLMTRTVVHLYGLDLGFKPSQKLEGEMMLKGSRYASPSAQRDFMERLRASLPSAGVTSHFPLSQSVGMAGYRIQREDKPLPSGTNGVSMTGANAISDNYFPVMGAKVMRGRNFEPREHEPVVIVNQTFANKYFTGEDPIGKSIIIYLPMQSEMDALAPGSRRIVGIIKDISEFSPTVVKAWPQLYVPFDQNPVPWVSVVIDASAETLKSTIAQLDPDIPVFRVHTARELVEEAYAAPRFQFMMLGTFSLLALFLSSIGIFSMIAQSVQQRRREFGIRLALGATPVQVRLLAIRDGLMVAAAGLVVGLGLAALLGPLTAALLYDVQSWDTGIAAAAVLIVLATVALACFLPAWEASHADTGHLIG